MSVISTRSLTRLYGKRVGIEGLSLTVPEGTLFGFLGPNGSGKSTTIRVLLGFLRATRGGASVFGLDCWRESRTIKADVGYVPGDLRLYGWMTGSDALRIFGAVRRIDLTAEGEALAERFRLDLGVRVRSMSRGMRQKLGLILAMAHRPRLLILDEPSSGLDPLMQQELRRVLRAMAAEGRTVFFSSHTLGEVERMCDRIAIVREGRLVADSSLTELRRRARRAVTLRWADGETPPELPPPFLEVRDRGERSWSATLRGPVGELLRWAAGQSLDDMTVGHPDLESLFRGYYEEGSTPS